MIVDGDYLFPNEIVSFILHFPFIIMVVELLYLNEEQKGFFGIFGRKMLIPKK